MIGKETLLRPLCLFSAAVRLDSARETRCIDAARAAILVLVETRIEHDSSNVSNSATAISPLGSLGHNDSIRYAASDTLSEAISRVVRIARRPVRRLERCGKMKEGKHLEGRVLRVLFPSAGVRALVVKLLIEVERQVMFLAGVSKDGSGLSTLRPKPIRWRRSFLRSLFQGS